MSERQTRVSLPEPVNDRWSERLEWYRDAPEDYELSASEREAIKTLSAAPFKQLKTRCVYQLPYHGKEHPVTQMAGRILHMAIYDAYDLGGDISSSHESKLQTMLERWVEFGEFKMPPAKPRPKPSDEVAEHRKRVESLVHEYVGIALNLLIQSDSPVICQPGFKDKLVVKTSWAKGRRKSRGGYYGEKKRPRVSFALKHRYEYDPIRDVQDRKEFFHEYARIAKSPQIGSCAGPLEVMVATIVAHEMAHAAQMSCIYSYLAVANTVNKNQLRKVHGEGWQEIYRYLRVNWVNKMAGYEPLKSGS